MAVIREDEVKESYFKNIRVDLLNSLPMEIFTKQWGKLGIIPEMLSCDYYNWVADKPSAIFLYRGIHGAVYLGRDNLGYPKNSVIIKTALKIICFQGGLLCFMEVCGALFLL